MFFVEELRELGLKPLFFQVLDFLQKLKLQKECYTTCPARDEAVGLVLPYANMKTMEIHLEHISMRIPKGRHGVIVLDQAGWHTSKRLKKMKNITLVSLPPASPELNPTEQVWRQLREDRLANRCFESEEEIIESCCEAWNQFEETKGAVQKLCSRSWANLIV